MRFSAAAYAQDQYDRLHQKDKEYRYSHNYFNVTPSASASYVVNQRCSFDLSSNMSLLRPSISALNPYIDKTDPLRWTYGNEHLKPERSQNFVLASNLNLKRIYMSYTLSYSYADRVILNHRFLEGNVLHITNDNIGIRHTARLGAHFSAKVTKTSYFRLTPSLNYLVYRSGTLNQSNHGFVFNINGQWEQELPLGLNLELSGRYNTPYIWLEGKGGKDFGYNITLSRTFINNKLNISCYASNFSPIHYTKQSEYRTNDYAQFSSTRNYHASFGISVRFNFGKLKVHVKETEKTIENNDIKQDYDE